MAEWSIAAVLKTVVLRGTRGSNPCLSAEPTGQNRTVRGQKPTNQRFVGFFIAYKSCFQDNKRTVKDIVSLLNRYLLEKPLNFAPFGHAELSLLAKI